MGLANEQQKMGAYFIFHIRSYLVPGVIVIPIRYVLFLDSRKRRKGLEKKTTNTRAAPAIVCGLQKEAQRVGKKNNEHSCSTGHALL